MDLRVTLLGIIPGLLLRGSPVLCDREGPWGLLSGTYLDAGSADDPNVVTHGLGPKLLRFELDKIQLNLSNATGRVHAKWWLEKNGLEWFKLFDSWLTPFSEYGDHRPADRNVWMSFLSLLGDIDTDDRLLEDGSFWREAEALRRVIIHAASLNAAAA